MIQRHSLVMMMGLAILSLVMRRILVQCDGRKLMLASVAIARPITPLLPDGHEEGVYDRRFTGIMRPQDQYV